LKDTSNNPLGYIGLLRAAWVEFERDHARYFAVAMIYYAIISMVPLLLLLLSVLGLLLRYSSVVVETKQQVLYAIETSLGPTFATQINTVLETLRQDSILASFIGLVGLLLTASVLFHNLRLSFRAIWKYDPPLMSGTMRSAVKSVVTERAKAFAMVVSGGGLLIAALILMAAAQWVNRVLGTMALADVASLVLATFTFALLFKYLPPVRLSWKEVRLAALLSAVAWVVVSQFLTLYGSFISKNPTTYGAISGLLVLMLWMKIVSTILFFGAELCKVIAGGSGGLRGAATVG
jgi:membrane protein